MDKLKASLNQFEKALTRLEEAVNLPETDVVRDSAVQRFEFTLDISWKMLKTYLEDKMGLICTSPKSCFREAYRQGIISYDDKWMGLVDMRNETVHTYNEEVAKKIYRQLPGAVKLFKELLKAIKEQ